MGNNLPTVLVIGATGKIGRPLVENLVKKNGANDVRVIAVTRDSEKAGEFEAQGIETRILDLNRAELYGLDEIIQALEGIDRIFLLTGYDVNMLAQSKAVIDATIKTGVRHMVHVGTYSNEDTTAAHLGWHLFIEKYIEAFGLGWTHLRPNVFMQNMLMFGGKNSPAPDLIEWYTGDAPMGWVDCEDIAEIAGVILREPENFNGQKIPLSVERASMPEIVEIFKEIIGQPFRYEAREPDEFVRKMISFGADPAYMNCVGNVLTRIRDRSMTEAADVYGNFEAITGRKPTSIRDFVTKHKEFLRY